jgi:hypothetical protein
VPISVIHNACGGPMMPFKDGTCRTCGRPISRVISLCDCRLSWAQPSAVVKGVPRRWKRRSLVLLPGRANMWRERGEDEWQESPIQG